MKRDFGFVCTLFEQFFQQAHVQNRLEFIGFREVTGWEIWLQIEFSAFIHEHVDIATWEREFLYSIDRRSARHRKHMAIDFIIRKKFATKDQYIALEIKQNSNVKSCIRGMMEDTYKVSLVKGSVDDLRSMWTIGIHPFVEKEELFEIVDFYAEQFGVRPFKDCISTQPINTTKLSYTIF